MKTSLLCIGVIISMFGQLVEQGSIDSYCLRVESQWKANDDQTAKTVLKRLSKASGRRRRDLAIEFRCLSPSFEFLVNGLKNKSSVVRNECVSQLSNVQDSNRVPVLKVAMNNADPIVRSKLLYAIHSSDAGEGLLLARRYVHDPATEVRGASAFLLGKFGDDKDWPIVFKMCSDRKSSIRSLALLAVKMPSNEQRLRAFTEMIINATKDTSESVRLITCDRLAAEFDEIGESNLKYMAITDRSLKVRQRAVNDLGDWYLIKMKGR